MKITGIRTYLMQAGPPRAITRGRADPVPLTRGGGSSSGNRQWAFVKIQTDRDIDGVGEGSGWPHLIERGLQEVSHLLIGRDPGAIEDIRQVLKVALMGHGQLGCVAGGILSAIDMALWDIKGKALGTPVWNLLGGKLRDHVPVYVHASTPDAARRCLDMGFRAIKTGMTQAPEATLNDLRAAVGPDVDLMIDMHGPPWMTPKDAIRLARALEPVDLLFVEDPVAPDNQEHLKQVRDNVPQNVAAGERLTGIHELGALITNGCVDIVQPDTGRAGGITEMRKLAAIAEAHTVSMAPHAGSLGPVAEFAALHVLASIPNALILERFADDWEHRNAVITPAPEPRDGMIQVPDRPGLGVELVEEAIAAHPPERSVALPRGAAAGTRPLYVETRTRSPKP